MLFHTCTTFSIEQLTCSMEDNHPSVERGWAHNILFLCVTLNVPLTAKCVVSNSRFVTAFKRFNLQKVININSFTNNTLVKLVETLFVSRNIKQTIVVNIYKLTFPKPNFQLTLAGHAASRGRHAFTTRLASGAN